MITGRLHEALAVSWALYQEMLAAQAQTGRRLHKGIPLVWAEVRTTEATPKIDSFVAFQRLASKWGRPELAQAPALRLVVASTPADWHQAGIGLHHLSHVLRLAGGATSHEMQRFLDAIATPRWIDGLMETAPAGGLAGNLLALVTVLEPSRRGWFSRECLRQRVLRELSLMRGSRAEAQAQIIALLGAAAAIGISIAAVQIDWPDTQELAEVVALRLPDADRTTIGPMQIQLWLGLREMTRLRRDSVTAHSSVGERILLLWQARQERDAGLESSPHIRILNATMLAWLQQCSAAGWRLVPS